jgi:hypothetical protein
MPVTRDIIIIIIITLCTEYTELQLRQNGLLDTYVVEKFINDLMQSSFPKVFSLRLLINFLFLPLGFCT